MSSRDRLRNPVRRVWEVNQHRRNIMTTAITNSDDIIDSRDVIARIADIESTLESVHEEEGSDKPFSDWLATTAEDSKHVYQDEAEELIALRALAEEAEGYSNGDWQHGATLIREEYFTEYAEQLCKDIGDIPENIPDYLVIDWAATAENLKVDYTEVDFDGTTYLVR
jgi:hypothetical protein